MYTENIVKFAKDALAKPEDFGYWGSEDMFKTWGFTAIDKTRDSDILELSNFEVITNDLISRFPDEFRIETYKHWACGSVDRLICKILNSDNDITEDSITQSFKAAMLWKDKLDEYSIADEGHYLEMEHLNCVDSIKNASSDLLFMIDCEIENYAERIYADIVDFKGYCDQYMEDDDILYSVYRLQIWNDEAKEEWDVWTDMNDKGRLPFVSVHPNQLKLFED